MDPHLHRLRLCTSLHTAPRTSQVNNAVSLVETVVATGGLLIPTESEKEICDVYIQPEVSLITGLEYGMNVGMENGVEQ